MQITSTTIYVSQKYLFILQAKVIKIVKASIMVYSEIYTMTSIIQ